MLAISVVVKNRLKKLAFMCSFVPAFSSQWSSSLCELVSTIVTIRRGEDGWYERLDASTDHSWGRMKEVPLIFSFLSQSGWCFECSCPPEENLPQILRISHLKILQFKTGNRTITMREISASFTQVILTPSLGSVKMAELDKDSLVLCKHYSLLPRKPLSTLLAINPKYSSTWPAMKKNQPLPG